MNVYCNAQLLKCQLRDYFDPSFTSEYLKKMYKKSHILLVLLHFAKLLVFKILSWVGVGVVDLKIYYNIFGSNNISDDMTI